MIGALDGVVVEPACCTAKEPANCAAKGAKAASAAVIEKEHAIGLQWAQRQWLCIIKIIYIKEIANVGKNLSRR